MNSTFGDIRELDSVRRFVAAGNPEIVFHLAAQSLVRESYELPAETFATNVMGTVNMLEVCRPVTSIRAVVIVTSDKCYENREWVWGYRESEAMGGRDPYSASKGCAELVTAAYRASFFSTPDCAALASARAGNVIGGGDWARDRLVPDLITGFISGKPSIIRNPEAIRKNWLNMAPSSPKAGTSDRATHLPGRCRGSPIGSPNPGVAPRPGGMNRVFTRTRHGICGWTAQMRGNGCTGRQSWN